MKYQSTKPGLATAAIIAIVVVAIAAVGGGVYVLTQDDDDAQTSEQTQTSDANAESSESAESQTELEQSFSVYQNALETDAKVRCDYTSADGYEGTVYVDSSTRMRINGTSADGEAASFIRDGDTYYGWVESEENGFKVTIDPNQTVPDNFQTFSEDNFEVDETEATADGSVECREDSFSDDLFTPPSDVNFQGFGDFQIPS